MRGRRKPLPGRHLAQLGGARAGGYLFDQPVLRGGARSVDKLPQTEEYEPLLHRIPVERTRHRVDRVRENVDDVPPGLRLAVRRGIEPVDQHVHVFAGLGETRRDLLAEEKVRVAG